jgi:hypothetical protein
MLEHRAGSSANQAEVEQLEITCSPSLVGVEPASTKVTSDPLDSPALNGGTVMAKQMTPDPAIGVWKLNVPKSSFRLVPAPKSSVMKVEPWEDGLKVSADSIDAQGNRLHPETAYKFDGKDYPLKGSPLADTISAKRINERTGESVWKKDGKVILTVRTVISADGKTLNLTRTGKDAQGRTVEDVMVYDKQ